MSAQSVPPDLIPYLLGEKKDYSSVQGSIITVNVTFLTLICLTTGLRFWVRFGMLRAAGLDDVLMIIALTFAILLSTSCLVGYSFGLGKHIWNLSPVLTELPAATARIIKSLYGCYLAYATAIAFVKFSIMATYFRIFVPKSNLRKVVLAIAALVLCIWISSIFAIIFTCVPVKSAWDFDEKGKCYPVVNFFYVSSSFNITTDLVLCFLPLPMLWALKMPVAQRVVLCILFSGGTFACVASILRLAQLHHLSGVDVPYQTVSSLNWSVVEVGTAIICSSLSALRPLATRSLPKLFQNFSYPSLTPAGSSQSNSKVSTSKHIRINSLPSKIPTSKFSTLNKKEGDSDGTIMVERTFDLMELKELPPVLVMSPMSPIPVSKRGSSKMDKVVADMGLFNDTTRLFERSSEEDMHEVSSPGKGAKT